MRVKYIYLFLIAVSFISCRKWLDVKKNKNDVILKTLNDYQALMNDDQVMNSSYPTIGLVASDDYFLDFSNWQSMQTTERNAYIWATDIFEGSISSDWNSSYKLIMQANVALEGLEKIDRTQSNEVAWNNVKGSALFFRAYAFYNLAQIFAKPYSKNSALTDLGIPLRFTTDVNQITKRSTLKDTYHQIINDLKEAEGLLPISQNQKTQPAKIAVQALLARIYLTMEEYENARVYAELVLNSNSTLIDYNSLNVSQTFPFSNYQSNNSNFNVEILFYSEGINYFIILPNFYIKIDSLLYDSYDSSDLRRNFLFRSLGNNSFTYRGTYTGAYSQFAGISINEIYFISAEANARLNNTNTAMNTLNSLLIKRWKSGMFLPLNASTADEALAIILRERRKEFVFNRIRWEDLRRLNKDSRFEKVLKRNLNGQIFTLPPNDNRYTFPIPDDEIRLSGIEQNPR